MIPPAAPPGSGGLIKMAEGAEEARPTVNKVFQVAGGQPESQAFGLDRMEPGSERLPYLPGGWIPDRNVAVADFSLGAAAKPPQGCF